MIKCELYNQSGKLMSADNDSECVCKHEEYNDKSEKFFVRCSSSLTLFDPWGMLSEWRINNEIKHKGKLEWSFRSVSQRCYDLYLKFIQTKNKAYLLHAQREVRNG